MRNRPTIQTATHEALSDALAPATPPVWLRFNDGLRRVLRTVDAGTAHHVMCAPWNRRTSAGVLYVPRLASQCVLATDADWTRAAQTPDDLIDSVGFVAFADYATPRPARRPVSEDLVGDEDTLLGLYSVEPRPQNDTAWRRRNQESRDEYPTRARRLPKRWPVRADGQRDRRCKVDPMAGWSGVDITARVREAHAIFRTHERILKAAGVPPTTNQRRMIWRDCWRAIVGETISRTIAPVPQMPTPPARDAARKKTPVAVVNRHLAHKTPIIRDPYANRLRLLADHKDRKAPRPARMARTLNPMLDAAPFAIAAPKAADVSRIGRRRKIA